MLPLRSDFFFFFFFFLQRLGVAWFEGVVGAVGLWVRGSGLTSGSGWVAVEGMDWVCHGDHFEW
jgi:hypothetical protein